MLAILDRLANRTVCPSLLLVKPAYSLNAVQDLTDQTPAAFVHPIDAVAGPNIVDNCVRQMLTERWGVLLAALVGYQPTGWEDVIEYVSGQLVDLDASVIWWREVFRTTQQRAST